MRWKISLDVNEGPSGGSCVRRPESEDPHRHERKLIFFLLLSPAITFLPEGVVRGLQTFAWAMMLFEPALCNFRAEKGGILKNCPRVLKIQI
jgi:hypothetical protein